MSKALTNSLALLQEIKSQLAAGGNSQRIRQPLNTLIDRRSPQSPARQYKSRDRDKMYDLPRSDQQTIFAKGIIRQNQAKPCRVYELLKQARDMENETFKELESEVSEHFDIFIQKMRKKHEGISQATESMIDA